MKTIKFMALLMLAVFAVSCTSVKVVSDFDRQADFTKYKTYAFFKPGIDKAEISDLDKKRILRAIEDEMTAKGFVKSETPDMLISIVTKEKERIDAWNSGNPWMYGPGYNNVSTRTEGILYIDIIDAERKELVWQGKGSGTITENMDKKEERIRKFVQQILGEYPPQPKSGKQKYDSEEYF
ncbi:MAG: DUF4136 domain-containing protein [Sinomicrobium sp.]|nr:DUF4136 domain-containing protein [Sinomicrobium sp.]